VGCALRTFRTDKARFERVQAQGMKRDSSWDTAASKYEEIFTWATIDPPYCG
jgi:starch synthase